MKKVSFLVAILALLQIASGTQTFAQERLPDDTRRNVEEALEVAGEEITQELEEMLRQLELNAEKIGQQLERWAEDNSHELESWSEKHAEKWESWGERFGKQMERLADDQEDIWGNWAQKYEKDLNRWTNELESSEQPSKQLGQFVEKNLKTLSKMPLGQMVDNALEEGLGQLSEAPWESLEELGELADGAFEELSELLEEHSNQRQPTDPDSRGVGSALEEFDAALDHKMPAAKDRPQVHDRVDPRVKALMKLREREDITRQQRVRIDEIIRSIQDASRLKTDLKNRADPNDRPRDQKPRINVPRSNPIKKKVEREKKRQVQQDRRLPTEEPTNEAIRKSNQNSKQLDARLPKRADGKNAIGSQKKPTHSQQDASQRFQRDGRDGKANRKPAAETNRNASAKSEAKAVSEIELLREEIAKLRREMQSLKKKSDK